MSGSGPSPKDINIFILPWWHSVKTTCCLSFDDYLTILWYSRTRTWQSFGISGDGGASWGGLYPFYSTVTLSLIKFNMESSFMLLYHQLQTVNGENNLMLYSLAKCRTRGCTPLKKEYQLLCYESCLLQQKTINRNLSRSVIMPITQSQRKRNRREKYMNWSKWEW